MSYVGRSRAYSFSSVGSSGAATSLDDQLSPLSSPLSSPSILNILFSSSLSLHSPVAVEASSLCCNVGSPHEDDDTVHDLKTSPLIDDSVVEYYNGLIDKLSRLDFGVIHTILSYYLFTIDDWFLFNMKQRYSKEEMETTSWLIRTFFGKKYNAASFQIFPSICVNTSSGITLRHLKHIVNNCDHVVIYNLKTLRLFNFRHLKTFQTIYGYKDFDLSSPLGQSRNSLQSMTTNCVDSKYPQLKKITVHAKDLGHVDLNLIHQVPSVTLRFKYPVVENNMKQMVSFIKHNQCKELNLHFNMSHYIQHFSKDNHINSLSLTYCAIPHNFDWSMFSHLEHLTLTVASPYELDNLFSKIGGQLKRLYLILDIEDYKDDSFESFHEYCKQLEELHLSDMDIHISKYLSLSNSLTRFGCDTIITNYKIMENLLNIPNISRLDIKLFSIMPFLPLYNRALLAIYLNIECSGSSTFGPVSFGTEVNDINSLQITYRDNEIISDLSFLTHIRHIDHLTIKYGQIYTALFSQLLSLSNIKRLTFYRTNINNVFINKYKVLSYHTLAFHECNLNAQILSILHEYQSNNKSKNGNYVVDGYSLRVVGTTHIVVNQKDLSLMSLRKIDLSSKTSACVLQ